MTIKDLIKIEEGIAVTKNREGKTILVHAVTVGDCDPLYIDDEGHSYSSSRCFDSLEELREYYHD